MIHCSNPLLSMAMGSCQLSTVNCQRSNPLLSTAMGSCQLSTDTSVAQRRFHTRSMFESWFLRVGYHHGRSVFWDGRQENRIPRLLRRQTCFWILGFFSQLVFQDFASSTQLLFLEAKSFQLLILLTPPLLAVHGQTVESQRPAQKQHHSR